MSALSNRLREHVRQKARSSRGGPSWFRRIVIRGCAKAARGALAAIAGCAVAGGLILVPGSAANAAVLGSCLYSGQVMHPGDYLAAPSIRVGIDNFSPYQLYMQTDGNLVEYTDGGQPLWDSQTAGHPGAYAVLQASDGNLVVYPQSGGYLWSAFVPNSPADRLCLQDDGNLVVYSASNSPVWATMTTNGTGINGPWGQTLSWNPGAAGQCTWWAENEFHSWNVAGAYINTLGINGTNGNALNWAYNASQRGWPVGNTPRIGSIAVFQPGPGVSRYGHVAWVTEVYPSQNAIWITEMNYNGFGVVDQRRIAPAFGVPGLQYIYANP